MNALTIAFFGIGVVMTVIAAILKPRAALSRESTPLSA
jgi:hypothetical protein